MLQPQVLGVKKFNKQIIEEKYLLKQSAKEKLIVFVDVVVKRGAILTILTRMVEDITAGQCSCCC